MTILVGILCQGAIVIAADSKWTNYNTGVSEYAKKISLVKFSVDDVLIARAGLPAIGNRLLEIIKENAKGVVIKSASTVTDIVESAIQTLKSKSDKEQWEYGEKFGCDLMIGFYAAGKPCLFTINVYGHGVVDVPLNHYTTAGCGQALAEYLLQEFSKSGAEGNVAITTAIYVVKKVKDHQSSYCGGDTTVGVLQQMFISSWENGYVGKSMIMGQDIINKTENLLIEADNKTKDSRSKDAVTILTQIAQEAWGKHLEQVKAEELEEKRLQESSQGVTIFHQCSQCETGFTIRDTDITEDRKGVRCPKCGKIDPKHL